VSIRRSRFFKDYIPKRGHLVKGKAGVGGEVTDLRNDIDGTFVEYENEGNLSQNNPNATTDPGPNDDITQGYGVLSYWINQTSGEIFACSDPSAGAAVWQNVTLTLVGSSVGSVKSRSFNAPPVPPYTIGDRYIVNPPGAGVWSGHDNEIAEWTGTVWIYTVPSEGDKVWVEDESRNYIFNGSVWTFPEDYIDHNSLQNLDVGDVHTQYQLRSERNAADGYAGLDGSGEVADAQHGSRSGGTLHDAATPTVAGFMSAADKGKLNGVDPGATNTPLSDTAPLDVDRSAADAGVAAEASRQDHKHDISVGPPSDVGTANAEGSSTSLARQDHVHNHANQPGGTLHAGATPTVAGFMSGGDKTKLDGVAPGATNTPLSSASPVNVNKAAAAPGTATAASRSDHKHSVDTGVPVSLGPANAEGTSTSLARSDHEHAHGNQGGGSQHAAATPATAGFLSAADKTKLDASGALTSTPPANVTKAAAAAGVSGESARADHKHDVTTAQPGVIQVGDTAAEGTAISLARSDHVHAVTAPGPPANVDKSAAAAGASNDTARADHKHDVSTGTPVAIGAANQEGTAATLSRSDHVHSGATVGDVDGPASSLQYENARFADTTGKVIEGSGTREYDPSATNPTTPTPGNGDRYYNTALGCWMSYDAVRGKWLSTATATIVFGYAGNNAPGSYYRAAGGVIMSATNGHTALANGTIVAVAYTRDDTDSADFEVTADGTTIATLNSTALKGKALNLNADFAADQVLAVRNGAAGNTTTNVTGSFCVKWRV
jgi:hypothetical protein